MVNFQNCIIFPNYVSPPYSRKERRYFSSRASRNTNEQALVLCADNLPDGEERAVIREFYFDIQHYQRLQLSVHAESPLITNTRDGETELFVRLGPISNSDYFEVTIPLTIMQIGEKDPKRIWPKENALNLDFRDLGLIQLKGLREYKVPNPNGDGIQLRIKVVGSPNLNSEMIVMIGIRNRVILPDNDYKSKSICLWLNDLRLIRAAPLDP